MEQTLQKARRRGNLYFAFGWALTLINLGAMVWAVGLPFILRAMPQDVFFSLEDAVRFAFGGCVSIAALAFFALLQVVFVDRIGRGMVEDLPETIAAEASLKLARYTAYIAMFFLVASFLFDLRTYRAWADFLAVR
jgi:hypothetical protein